MQTTEQKREWRQEEKDQVVTYVFGASGTLSLPNFR